MGLRDYSEFKVFHLTCKRQETVRHRLVGSLEMGCGRIRVHQETAPDRLAASLSVCWQKSNCDDTATARGLCDWVHVEWFVNHEALTRWPWRCWYISVGAGDARTWLITLRRVMANNAVPWVNLTLKCFRWRGLSEMWVSKSISRKLPKQHVSSSYEISF